MTVVAAAAQFVFVRVCGRGDYTIAHLVASNGNDPLCGARINPKHWDLRLLRQATHKILCRQCQTRRDASIEVEDDNSA